MTVKAEQIKPGSISTTRQFICIRTMIATLMSQEPRRQTSTAAVMTFFGPDATSKIKAVNPTGVEVADFTIDSTSNSDFAILRHISPTIAPVTICTGHKSSLVGSTKMNVHGQEVKFATTSGGLAILYYVLETTMLGKLTWKGSSSGKLYELVDCERRMIAQADLAEMRFTVFVPGDEVMFDCLLAGWVALVHTKKGSAESSKHALMACKIIGHLAGGVGGAGS
jgi:hypothetical protein